MTGDAHSEKRAREATLFSCAAGPLGYLAWGWPQALAATLALLAASFLAGAVFYGFDYRFVTGWGKWALWAAQALYHGRLARRDAAAQMVCQQALADHGWATAADSAVLQRELRAHLFRVVFYELGFLAFAALSLGALMAFDSDETLLRAFAAASLGGKFTLLQGIYCGLAIICAVALFAWSNLTATLDRLFERRLQAALQRE